MNLRKFCCVLVGASILAGCSGLKKEGGFFDQSFYDDEKIEERVLDKDEVRRDKLSLEERLNDVYIKIKKDTSEGVPTLYLRSEINGNDYMEMPVAIGVGNGYYSGSWKEWETPEGNFEVAGIFYQPIWYPPKGVDREGPVRPGENNPLGDWMLILLDGSRGYDKKDINSWGDADYRNLRIHSTNRPDSIGKRASMGCVRMHPESAEKVADFLIKNFSEGYSGSDISEEICPDKIEFDYTFRGKYLYFKNPLNVYIRD